MSELNSPLENPIASFRQIIIHFTSKCSFAIKMSCVTARRFYLIYNAMVTGNKDVSSANNLMLEERPFDLVGIVIKKKNISESLGNSCNRNFPNLCI